MSRFRRLRLFAFRNYADTAVDLHPGLNIFSGDNAQGKSNLLEALATVALTRSPRTHSLADAIRWDEPVSQLDVIAGIGPHDRHLSLRLSRTPPTGRLVRSFTIDGKHASSDQVLGLCPVVTFWPDDLLLVKAGPELRRTFLDTLLSQTDPPASRDLLRYRRVLSHRNALLRAIRAGAPPAPLATFTRQLAEHGARVRVARHRLALSLSDASRPSLHSIASPTEDLSLTYVDQAGHTLDQPLATIEAGLAESLHSAAAQELAAATTLSGPHRDDLAILLNGRPARTAASQGQHRSIVLALKLAEMALLATARDTHPVLLLDDVLSELDSSRSTSLLDAVSRHDGAQAVITANQPPALPPSPLLLHHYHVVGGSIVPAPS